jgi:hypothetical protein
MPEGEDNSIIQILGSGNVVKNNIQVQPEHSFSVIGSDNIVSDNQADYFFVRALFAWSRHVPRLCCRR